MISPLLVFEGYLGFFPGCGGLSPDFSFVFYLGNGETGVSFLFFSCFPPYFYLYSLREATIFCCLLDFSFFSRGQKFQMESFPLFSGPVWSRFPPPPEGPIAPEFCLKKILFKVFPLS